MIQSNMEKLDLGVTQQKFNRKGTSITFNLYPSHHLLVNHSIGLVLG